MPRTRRTQGGAPAQPVKSVPGQRYGEGVAQRQMQRAMPTPNLRAPGGAAPTPPATAPTEPPEAPGDPMAAAAGMDRELGMLNAPTAYPDEPITTGLSVGLGAGPEVMLNQPTMSPQARFLEELSSRTGDPFFADLARRARM